MEGGDEERVKISDYGRVLIPSRKEMAKDTRGLDKDQRKVVDISVKYARDIVKAWNTKKALPEPPHLMVHGSAGTGNLTRSQNISENLMGFHEISWDLSKSHKPYVYDISC